jgi:hypothetical protein
VDLATTTTSNASVHGINLDFEFTWPAATRDGMMQWIRDLRAVLNSLPEPLELSIYTTPTWSAVRYDAATLRDFTDYVIPSGYDYATGLTVTATGRYGPASQFSILQNTDNYISAGIPPEKLVVALPFYGRAWESTNPNISYGQNADVRTSARGFLRSNFDTTFLLPNPIPSFDATPPTHQSRWSRQEISPGTFEAVTFDDMVTLENKVRMVKAWPGNQQTGRPLAGVAFWSLMWLTEASGRDPNNLSMTNLRRTAGGPYNLLETLFAPPGTRRFRIDTFEGTTLTSTGFSTRWVAAGTSPDSVAVSSSSRQMVATPSGGPAGDVRSLQFSTNFSGPGRGFLRYQFVVGSNAAPHSLDLNHHLVALPRQARLRAWIHTPANYANASVAMVVRDAQGQFEKGPAVSLATAGWREVVWDLASNAAGNVNPFNTVEGFTSSGDGILQTAGQGAQDIHFAGFEIVTGGAVNTQLNVALLEWEISETDGARYVINEFRYADTTQQFVEIYGPAGPLPAGLVLRGIDGNTGTTSTELLLTGTIPDDTGNGFGYHVIGTNTVPHVDQVVSSGFFPTASPSAIELFEIPRGRQHDALAYRAHGGVRLIGSPGNPKAADFGPGWQGEISNGGDTLGNRYTLGRYPDGFGEGSNEENFTPMGATPGAPNGNAISGPVTFDFDVVSPVSQAFRTYNAASSGNFTVEAPPAGVGPSPNGGNVHRCVDSSGGGAVTYFGDAAFGHNGQGQNVAGQVFVPAATQPVQSIGLGLCVGSGSTFFSGSPGSNGMDRGYWLIYQNAPGANLNHGQGDHPGTWLFVHATNDGLGFTSATTVLGSASNAALGLPNGGGVWTSFRLSSHRNVGGNNQLLATVNGVEIYRGPLPADGPFRGPFAVGFRENHPGGPIAVEGTWIDALEFHGTPVPVHLSAFDLD